MVLLVFNVTLLQGDPSHKGPTKGMTGSLHVAMADLNLKTRSVICDNTNNISPSTRFPPKANTFVPVPERLVLDVVSTGRHNSIRRMLPASRWF